MKITHNLLPKQKARTHNLNVEIDVYPYAEELYTELERIGIIERIKQIPQLGVIRVKSKLAKTRYDYVILQLYLHQLIKQNLGADLKLSYNNYVKASEFENDYKYLNKDYKPTIGDFLQILSIIYNIGHFYNTFTASRAVIMTASEDRNFFDKIVGASSNGRYKVAATKILKDKNYQRFHLLNGVLILEKCNSKLPSVSLALEILYAYINEPDLTEESKLRYIFGIFRNVRTVSYMAYDLQIARTPLTIDIGNDGAMLILLKELLSEYNDNQSSNHLVQSITKLLDDTVYNEKSNAICYYKISRRMTSLLTKNENTKDAEYYSDLFLEKSSALNRSYAQNRDYVQNGILKLTFKEEDRIVSEELLCQLEKINNTRVGYYDRHYGETTILVSIKKNCNLQQKRTAAFKSMKYIVNYLRRIPDVTNDDARFILCVKFFLFYLFGENPIVIKPTVNKEKCVICTRGKNARIKEITALLESSVGNSDEKHEVEFLLSRLRGDNKNDTTLTIPGSVLVYDKNSTGKKLCEFDGLIIYPMRKNNQAVFLEAKNRNRQPAYAKKCLKEKFDKLSLNYMEENIAIVNCDAYMEYDI